MIYFDMSIYPVNLAEWFPYGDDKHETALSIVQTSRCLACGSKIRWKRAIGHHSLPWGYGDIWCSEHCMDSGKTAKPDKRRERRMRRKYADLYEFFRPHDISGHVEADEKPKDSGIN